MKKLKITEIVRFLISLTLLFFVNPSIGHLEVDSSSLQPLKSSDKKVVYTTNGVSAEFLFAVDSFSQGQRFAAPMGVFYDKHNDEIYVADTGNDQVDVFDADGQPLFQIGAAQELKRPMDIVLRSDGQMYVSQMGREYLQLFDFRGRYLADLCAPETAPFKPGRMCLDAEGNLYVVDREKARILVHDAESNFQFQFGGKGEGEGRFRLISGVAVDSAGRIYVADSRQIPVQVFDKTGRFLLSFGQRDSHEWAISFSGGICIDEKDRIWVVDTFGHRIKVFRVDGTFLFQFGVFGTEAGQFFFPVDLALDGHGRVYVLEKGANRLQVFRVERW